MLRYPINLGGDPNAVADEEPPPPPRNEEEENRRGEEQLDSGPTAPDEEEASSSSSSSSSSSAANPNNQSLQSDDSAIDLFDTPGIEARLLYSGRLSTSMDDGEPAMASSPPQQQHVENDRDEDEPDISYFEHEISQDLEDAAAGARIPRSQSGIRLEPEEKGSSTSPLANVLAVLGLSAERLKACEGIHTLDDLLCIEDILRDDHVNCRSSMTLNSVERVRLVHYLDWRKQQQQRARQQREDDVTAFTREAYERFLRRRNHIPIRWPFGRDISTNVLLYPLTFISHDDHALSEDCESPQSKDSIEQFGLADLDIELYESEAGTYNDLHRGMERLRRIVEDADNNNDDDDDDNDDDDIDPLVHACACIKLSVLLHSVPAQDLVTAMELMKLAATTYQVPTALLFYGHALLTGEKGVMKDVVLGLRYLHQAASAGIGEAHYILGQYHEDVGDISMATDLYNKVSHIFGRPDRFGWRGLITGMSSLTASFRTKERFAISGPVIRGWCGCGLSEAAWATTKEHDPIGSFFLLLLVQVILLVATTMLSTQTTPPNHYPILLVGVPVLGLSISFHAFLRANEILRVNSARRQPIIALQQSKLEAFVKLLNMRVPRNILSLPNQILFLLQLFFQMVHQFNDTFSRSSTIMVRNNDSTIRRDVEAKLLWIEAVIAAKSSFNNATPGQWIHQIFVLVWILTLAQECIAVQDDCSSWWDSTCPVVNP